MIRVALPNKGSLSEGTVEMLREAGYRCRRHGRELTAYDHGNGVEFIFLRPKDIATYVHEGVLDVGITGRDLAIESQVDVEELLPLQFGRSSFCYAVPTECELIPDQFEGFRIATSYPAIVAEDMKRRGVPVQIVRLDGAVEVSVRLGVADAIADVVQTGRTLIEAGLKRIGEPVMESEAILIAKDHATAEQEEVGRLVERLRGIVVAREYAVVEYDIPKTVLDDACKVTPGLESPTISPLSNEYWVAVKAMVKRKDLNRIMDELAHLGAKGILVTDIRTCRM